MVIANKGSAVAMSEYEERRKHRALQIKGEQPARRTSAGLRDALFDEIDALRRGDGDPHRAIAVARLAANILAAAKMEIEYRRAETADPGPIKEIELGSKDVDAE